MSHWIDGNGGVYVAGIGLHRYQFPTQTPYTHLGLTAVRAALADAGLAWQQVQSAYLGTTSIGMAAGPVMLRHLGAGGLAVTQVENASASGSFAFRQACIEVTHGISDVVLALGVDKHGDGRRAAHKDGLEHLSDSATIPAVKFALMARSYLRERGAGAEAMARVAVKNHGNAARNPYAQLRKPRTLEQVLAATKVVGDLTVPQCCPRGEGAAAVLLVSGHALGRLGLERKRCVHVRASCANSERHQHPERSEGHQCPERSERHQCPERSERHQCPERSEGHQCPERSAPGAPRHGASAIELVRSSAQAALEQAGIAATQLDLLELHDAFSVEELLYSEAIGLCAPGEGPAYLERGDSQIGGRCAINASGGLLGMGHPLGPTGIGQIVEITRQLRGAAEGRQHPGARWGMAHMIGLGAVAIAHVLSA
ncbi:thiolase family protein [Verminephrobacter eiseniae]|uniref:thiolase family protein n=1 Tax=Verminephrobacter eiseniae TaxID=364317 RepID=UPI0010D1616C|nr:thiolase family protein [Verminephrobacter eiseniae]KAB7624281.1 thiolase family protein [Verminephrobacter sp. Larva24]MCW5234569.1 thiolase family protein [Verminephrobacter eiseniae]MCW5293855.1 thiolase family protein [Verminephrobacter eiseniae]MCW8183862.1 thiolase family protein [Verminephrobacter eiseniae]MCW8222390.1 thiolase family protein [Verminephrobacter eiseniae]